MDFIQKHDQSSNNYAYDWFWNAHDEHIEHQELKPFGMIETIILNTKLKNFQKNGKDLNRFVLIGFGLIVDIREMTLGVVGDLHLEN